MLNFSVDYSLYLVTGRDLLPPGKDYFESLEELLQGGVTIVQIREKTADTAKFIDIARRSKAICDKYAVPLLINDRVDVALAIGAHGVHVGQDDMPVAEVRRLLPSGSIIGVSCNNVGHVKVAIKDGVDYIGIGAIYGTKTKQLTTPLIGVRGVGNLLMALDDTSVKAIAIGGIKANNLLRTLHGSVSSTNHALDGVAVVSEIVASQTPRQAAEDLAKTINAFRAELSLPRLINSEYTPETILEGVSKLMSSVRELNPLIHQITNTVVATQSANITLALGGSPIMATEPQEMQDLARICGALLVNIGTMGAGGKEGMLRAGFFSNANRKPIVFDPVGVGASAFRKETVNDLLNIFQASVIKGNAGELATLAGSREVESKGVDSVGSGFKEPASFVRNLARKERCVVVLTGATDYISDGFTVVALSNGHDILGKITGSGCVLGSSIATYCATAALIAANKGEEGRLVPGDMFIGTIAGVLILTIATELAIKKPSVQGPGTFLSGLIDSLWTLKPEDVLGLAKVKVI
ncbi:thiamine biosynthetic bifunctional enzyme Thi4 [Cyathus striatus]|nr:thiamine biosynthetic bifunctional enzyme Thi4 [Cyathus striatus]